jgi:hypothetical protein
MCEALRTFTRAELATHVGIGLAEDERPASEQMLIAIDDFVYDMTKFESVHPGGKAVLRMVGGQDATEQFYALHNKDVLEKYHKKLCVGVLIDDGAKPTQKDLQLPKTTGEDLISAVPYAEIPLLRGNWANSPWWNESHRSFLLGIREILQSMFDDFMEAERSNDYVPDDIQHALGTCGILACMNGISVMGVAQKLKDEGKMTFPGGLEPRTFDIWHEYIANQECTRAIPGGVRNGVSGGMAISLPAIAQFWEHPKKDQVVELIILGQKRSCLAISEPHAGSDVANIVTQAKRSKCGKYYIVMASRSGSQAGQMLIFFQLR